MTRKSKDVANTRANKPRGADYLKVVEWSEEDGCFVGSAPPIIGPACHGADEIAVYKELCEIVGEWLEIMERDGVPVPPATLQKDYSGKFNLRTGPELHKALEIRATQVGYSLNAYCVRKLQEGLRLAVVSTGIVPATLRDANFEKIKEVRYQYEGGRHIPCMQVLPVGERLSKREIKLAAWLDFFGGLLSVPVSIHRERDEQPGIYYLTTPDKAPTDPSSERMVRLDN